MTPETRISGLVAETAQENAQSLLPGLQYLAREARWAELSEVAQILDDAINDISKWIRGTAN